MSLVVVEFDDGAALRDIKRRLGDLESKAPSILKNALDATARQAKKELATNAVNTYTGHKKKDYTDAMTIQRPTQSDLSAVIHAKGMMEDLSRFKVKSSSGVVKAQVLKKSTLKDLVRDNARAFMVTFSSGHETVAQRRTGQLYSQGSFIKQRMDQNHYKGWHGPSDLTKIKKLLGPSIPFMVGNDEVYSSEIKTRTIAMLQEQINKRIAKALEKGAST